LSAEEWPTVGPALVFVPVTDSTTSGLPYSLTPDGKRPPR
jgi:hypothetical protein